MKRAVCIGINDYPGTESDLSGCVNDANDWALALEKKGFKIVVTLTDAHAKGKTIIENLESLVDLSKKGDSMVVTYSGHGSYVPDEDGDEPDGIDECLCPYDIMDNGPIVDDRLYKIFSNIKDGVKAVFFSDSCHSGTVSKFMSMATFQGSESTYYRNVKFMPPQTFLPSRSLTWFSDINRSYVPPARKDFMLLMAGCQDHEYSYDAMLEGRPNGVFTFVALRTLKLISSRSTYSQWFKEIRKVLPSVYFPQAPALFAPSNMKRWRVLS